MFGKSRVALVLTQLFHFIPSLVHLFYKNSPMIGPPFFFIEFSLGLTFCKRIWHSGDKYGLPVPPCLVALGSIIVPNLSTKYKQFRRKMFLKIVIHVYKRKNSTKTLTTVEDVNNFDTISKFEPSVYNLINCWQTLIQVRAYFGCAVAS